MLTCSSSSPNVPHLSSEQLWSFGAGTPGLSMQTMIYIPSHGLLQCHLQSRFQGNKRNFCVSSSKRGEYSWTHPTDIGCCFKTSKNPLGVEDRQEIDSLPHKFPSWNSLLDYYCSSAHFKWNPGSLQTNSKTSWVPDLDSPLTPPSLGNTPG